MRSMFAVVAAIIVSISSARALESSVTVRSLLSPGELWKEVDNFCGLPAWDSAVEQCTLSADGKRRTIRFFGGAFRLEAEVEDWNEANRSFGWKNISESPSIANYHARVSVIADGQGSVLTWTASYEARGIPDAEARNVIEDGIYRTLCLGGGPLLCSDKQNPVAPAQMVSIESQSVDSTPIKLRGYLRRPEAAGPRPAVVLLHGCNGSPVSLDQNWGSRIAAWGYVTLTVDSFGPRGLKNTCAGGLTPDMGFDAYRALDFLAKQSFVDPKRAFVVGFSQGGLLSLSSVERGSIERIAVNKFLAAAAFYPDCIGVKGPMTVSTLILIGESDDWMPAEDCRKLAAGQNDFGISRQKGEGPPIQLIVYPGAYHEFDIPTLRRPINYFGHHIEFNRSVTDQSSEALHKFFQSVIDSRG